MSPRIAVAATAPFGADVLERLARQTRGQHASDAAGRAGGSRTKARRPAGEDDRRAPRYSVLQPERLERGLELGAETVVVVAYGKLIPEALLEDRSWLNVHPSLLPRWRGAAPVERAIMAGDVETGVTIHRTVKDLDAGPIAAQGAFLIEANDDAGEVYARVAELAVELLDEVLASPEPEFRDQPAEGATYADKIAPEDRLLDLERPPSELVDVVRGLAPHIGARAELHGRPATVWRAQVGEDGAFEPLEVQPAGGRRMEYDEWLRGLR